MDRLTHLPSRSMTAGMGSRDGAIRAAATRLGVDEATYRVRIDGGLKWCGGCRAWHPLADFAADASRTGGLTPVCRTARNARARAGYVRRPRPRAGRSFVPARDGDKVQARRRVNYFVEAGLLPAPRDLPCSSCGHAFGSAWSSARPARHEYHHHKGYAAKHHEDVVVLCSACHAEEG